MYMPIITQPQNIKQKLIERKGEIDKSTITVGNFNTNFSSIDTTKRPKKTQKQINKDIGNLKSMIN